MLDERLDPLGHAYQVALLSETREHAFRYLDQLSDDRSIPGETRPMLAAATRSYERIVRILHRLYPSFPFGMGGVTADREPLAEALGAAMEAEAESASSLEAASKLL